MIVLDCTFRDGGYYGNWQFDIPFVNDYLKKMSMAGIDAIEIGFRSPPHKQVGQFAKVTDFFIEENLIIPDTFKYFGVMINASDHTSDTIEKLFLNEKQSPINLVRIAVYFDQVAYTESLVEHLKFDGYTVTLNLMQAADKSYDQIRDAAKLVNSWGTLDVLYIADSLGGMNHDTVHYAFDALREGWSGLTGFHGHNNKGQALTNALEAIDIGVDWIDGTVMGMGRGPGNVEMEYLLNELNKRNFEFELEPVYELAMHNFYGMKECYGWGPSLPYYLSAEYNIHPTYIQKMLLSRMAMDKVLYVINYLKKKMSNKFNDELLTEACRNADRSLHTSEG